MMKCSKCGKNIIGNKRVKDNDNWQNVAGTLAIIFGGPLTMACGGISIGSKLFKKHIMNEVEIKCPHCKAKLTLTRAEYKELKKEVNAILDAERKSKQNRIER